MGRPAVRLLCRVRRPCTARVNNLMSCVRCRFVSKYSERRTVRDDVLHCGCAVACAVAGLLTEPLTSDRRSPAVRGLLRFQSGDLRSACCAGSGDPAQRARDPRTAQRKITELTPTARPASFQRQRSGMATNVFYVSTLIRPRPHRGPRCCPLRQRRGFGRRCRGQHSELEPSC